MTASDLLRKAADKVGDYALSEREQRRVKLVALHVLAMCGGEPTEETTQLLIELLDEGSPTGAGCRRNP